MKANLTPISASLFSWSDGDGVAGISDLGPGFRFQRLFDDAADIGLAVQSPKTGRELRFAVAEENKNADGDVNLWRLACIDPAFSDLSLTIFND